MYYKKTMVSC